MKRTRSGRKKYNRKLLRCHHNCRKKYGRKRYGRKRYGKIKRSRRYGRRRH